MKILTWIKVNIATILGTFQAALKALKEILTGIINLLSILIPASAAQKAVEKAREIVNIVDGWVENIKEKLIPNV
jgi:sorbitol-specific phosphotransferase system component IIC